MSEQETERRKRRIADAVIIAVIVYLSAFSLVIKMWIGKLGKKKDDGADANAEPAPAAASAPAGAQAETEKGGDAK